MHRRFRVLTVAIAGLVTLGGLTEGPAQAAAGSAVFTGTLTSGAGAPATGTVALDPQFGGDIVRVHPDRTGHWTATVAPGTYTVYFSNAKQYIYAHDTTLPEDAEVFAAAAGATIVVDQRFPTLAHVRGRVVDKVTGAPIEGVSVFLSDPANPFNPATPTAYGTTDATGRFGFPTFAFGNMAIRLDDSEGRYLAQYSGDTQNLSQARTKPVSEGGLAFFNVGMTSASTLTGRIVKGGGRGVRAVSVAIYAGRSDVLVGEASPDSEGYFTAAALPPGTVTLRFTPEPRSGLQLAWYLNADTQSSATLVTLTGGQVTHLQDQVLRPADG